MCGSERVFNATEPLHRLYVCLCKRGKDMARLKKCLAHIAKAKIQI